MVYQMMLNLGNVLVVDRYIQTPMSIFIKIIGMDLVLYVNNVQTRNKKIRIKN